ncbi:MAG: EAL domain-containing protein [Schaedlerella sp.]|nr:EAL domain-containing protein [Schaedlerella sp.]
MNKTQDVRSISQIMNDVLKTIREYYDSEYVYYVEKDDYEIFSIYEWCAEEVAWQRDKIKILSAEQQPRWLKQEITDTNADSYSVFETLSEGRTAVLAAVNVRRGGCDLSLMKAMLPFISQMIVVKKTQKQQEYLSYHDNLTGLLNRNSFVGYLTEKKEKTWKSLGALSADINGLKVFNQEFGREYGDEVVTRVGEVLGEYFHGASVFRMTGDEYLVIMENVSYDRFLKNVHGVREKLDNISLGLVSLGYAWEKVDINLDKLVARAENMMREEKQKYYKNLKKGHHEPIIKEDLLYDLDNGNFIVCLVPILDVDAEEVVAAEAIVRYHHKDLGIMNPKRYIQLLEETRLSHYLDLYVFERICQTLQRWEEENLSMIPISVNFCCSTLQDKDISRKMLEIVERYHVSCEYLQVEVSESLTEMNPEMLAETSRALRKENIRVILDHYGGKNSTVSILSIMEFDGLKLDKGLVSGIVGNSKSRIVAKAIIDVCRRLGVSVYASGAEIQDQLNVLKELGCNYVQGVLFNKPITIETFEVRYMRN